jgi:hypothetical protein
LKNIKKGKRKKGRKEGMNEKEDKVTIEYDFKCKTVVQFPSCREWKIFSFPVSITTCYAMY